MSIESLNKNSSEKLEENMYEVCKFEKTIQITKAHKEKRVKSVKKWITEDYNWDATPFSIEKRFTIDGSDNWMS